jgi:hypothetical protein
MISSISVTSKATLVIPNNFISYLYGLILERRIMDRILYRMRQKELPDLGAA